MVGISVTSTATVSQFTREASFDSRTVEGFEASPTTRSVEGKSAASLSQRGPSILTILVTQSNAPEANNDPSALAQATALLSDRDQASTMVLNSLASAATILQGLQPGSIESLTDDQLSTLAADLTTLTDLIGSTSGTLESDVDSFAAGVDLSADDVRSLLSSTTDVFSDIGGQFQSVRDLVATIDLDLAGEPVLTGPDYSGQDLSGVDFAGMDLSGANFRGAILNDANFDGVDLTGADFTGANLSKAKFQNATVVNADFEDANLQDANFDGAVGQGANFTNANLHKAKLQNSVFDNADFTGADLQQANFVSASLQQADLTNANVSNADFVQTDLRGAILVGVDLADVNGANLDGIITDPAEVPAAPGANPELAAALTAVDTTFDAAEISLSGVDSDFADLKTQAENYTPAEATVTYVEKTVTRLSYGGGGNAQVAFGSLGAAGKKMGGSLDRATSGQPFEIEVAPVNGPEETMDAPAVETKVLISDQIGQQVLEQSGAAAAYDLNKILNNTLIRLVLDVNA